MKTLRNQVALRELPLKQNLRLDPALRYSRGDPMGPDAYPPLAEKARYEVIGKLENNVSRLQIARHNLTRLNRWFYEMRDFLKELWDKQSAEDMPASVVNGFLAERIAQIRMTAEAASFGGKALLNGKCGVTAQIRGKGLYFVRGSARVLSSVEPGYPIAIQRPARSAELVGAETLDDERVRKEELIAIFDGDSEFKYRIAPYETAESLVENLKHRLAERGMEITVAKTSDQRLALVHQKLGSEPSFKGMSLKTGIVSMVPGKIRDASPGWDIEGTIGLEKAKGKGGFLAGKRGNKRTDGISVFYPGSIEYPGQVVGHIHVKQNGLLVPLDLKDDQAEILSLPALLPENLAVGVANQSGFTSIAEIRGDDFLQRKDALKLVQWAISEVKFLFDELKWKEEYYVELAVKLLKQNPQQNDDDDDILHLAKEKADQMAQQLKSLVSKGDEFSITT